MTEEIENIGRAESATLTLSDYGLDYLRETAKWAKFLAIMGFIGIGLIIILAIFMGSMMGTVLKSNEELNVFGPGLSVVISILYVAIGGIYIYPVLKLYQFATNTKRALGNNDSAALTAALENQKSMFKFMGIFTIILLGVYALMIIFGILGALTAFI